MATNRSIDKLRSAAHKRNVYVGMWLPEPLVDESDEPSKSFIMKRIPFHRIFITFTTTI